MKTPVKIAFNTTAQLVGKAITTTTTLIITILITRHFGPEGYGDFTIMTTYAALFYIVSDFGLNAIVTRELAADESKITHYFNNLLGMRLVLGLILFVIGTAALFFFPYSQFIKIGILVSLFTIFTQALYLTANAIFQLKLRYDLSVIAQVVGSLLIFVLVVAFIYFGLGIIPIAASYVFGGGVTILAAFFFLRRFVKYFHVEFDLTLWRKLFLAALPLGITTIFTVFLQKADSLLLSVLTTSQDVGYYGVAYKVFEVALVFPTFFVNSAFPIMVRHHNEGRDKFFNTVKNSALALFGIAVLGTITGVVLAPFIIEVIAGGDFGPSVEALRLLVLGLPVFYLSALVLWVLITMGEQKKIPFVYAIAAIFNVAANYILIPRYSFNASAVLTWTSELLILAMLSLIAFRKRK